MTDQPVIYGPDDPENWPVELTIPPHATTGFVMVEGQFTQAELEDFKGRWPRTKSPIVFGNSDRGGGDSGVVIVKYVDGHEIDQRELQSKPEPPPMMISHGGRVMGGKEHPANETCNACVVSRPTFWQRLGFGHTSGPDMDDLEALDDHCWAPGWTTECRIHFDWLDRLRILISGKVLLVTRTKTSSLVGQTISRSKTSILPPGTVLTRD